VHTDLAAALPERIETERLVIRPHRPGDAPRLLAATLAALPQLRQWPASFGWALETPTAESTAAFCRRCAEDFAARRAFPFLLIHRESGEIVGSSGLHDPDWNRREMEIGWWAVRPMRAKG